MKDNAPQLRLFWLPAVLFAGCLVVAFVAPLVFLLLKWELPLQIALLASLYLFPMEAHRIPDLPSGIQPGPNFRYELGTLPVVLTWVSALILFGFLAGRFGRGLRLWQVVGLVALAIGTVTLVMHLVLQHFGFRPGMTFL